MKTVKRFCTNCGRAVVRADVYRIPVGLDFWESSGIYPPSGGYYFAPVCRDSACVNWAERLGGVKKYGDGRKVVSKGTR